MLRIKAFFVRWGPALLWMLVIFVSSATPSTQLPRFGSLDFFVKKGGHMMAYAILALLFRRALGSGPWRLGGAWLLAVAYALLDEFHQSFVPGRHPSLVDVVLFDGTGAAIALAATRLIPRLRPHAPARAGNKT